MKVSLVAFASVVISQGMSTCYGFSSLPLHGKQIKRKCALLSYSTAPGANGDTSISDVDEVKQENMETSVAEKKSAEADAIKRKILQLGASYDRGYGASTSAGREMADAIEALEEFNEETDAARGISGDEPSPLKGKWRMVWTTAQDVLSLNVSPISVVGAIYQVFDPPIITNIIDFIPRAQAFFPPNVAPSSLLRAEVTTRGYPAAADQPMRVVLNFEAVKLKPVEFLGISVNDVLPPLGVNFPQIAGVNPENSPGYFDVAYLDDEMLIIKQNFGGGLFVLVRVEDNDP